MIDKEDIVFIILCILLSLILTIYLNKRINCCCRKYKKDTLIMYKEEFKNNSLEDNIKLINNIEKKDKQDKELELL